MKRFRQHRNSFLQGLALIVLTFLSNYAPGQIVDFLESNSTLNSHVFVPDYTPQVISEFHLKNGSVIRGKVSRMVPATSYEVETASGAVITILEEDIQSKKKVEPDIRENQLSQYAGITTHAIKDVRDYTFHAGLSFDFGKDLKYVLLGELSLGTFFRSTEYSPIYSATTIAVGYKANRTKRVSQCVYLGYSRFSTGILNSKEDAIYGRIELPVSVSTRIQIAPTVSYYRPVGMTNEFQAPFLSIGIIFRHYQLSAF